MNDAFLYYFKAKERRLFSYLSVGSGSLRDPGLSSLISWRKGWLVLGWKMQGKNGTGRPRKALAVSCYRPRYRATSRPIPVG